MTRGISVWILCSFVFRPHADVSSAPVVACTGCRCCRAVNTTILQLLVKSTDVVYEVVV
jgi:hypothetical protein